MISEKKYYVCTMNDPDITSFKEAEEEALSFAEENIGDEYIIFELKPVAKAVANRAIIKMLDKESDDVEK